MDTYNYVFNYMFKNAVGTRRHEFRNEHTHKNMQGRIGECSRRNTLTKNINKSNTNQVTKQAIKNSHAHLHISKEAHAQEYSRNVHARTHACISGGMHENKQQHTYTRTQTKVKCSHIVGQSYTHKSNYKPALKHKLISIAEKCRDACMNGRIHAQTHSQEKKQTEDKHKSSNKNEATKTHMNIHK